MKRVFCIIISLLMCVTVLFTGCNGDETPKGGVVDQTNNDQPVQNQQVQNPVQNQQDDQVKSDVEIVVDNNETVETPIGKEAEIFIGGEYFLECVFYAEDMAIPMTLASDGNSNYQFTAEASGLNFGMLMLEEQTYLILPNAKLYSEFSNMLAGALGIGEGLDVSEFQSINGEDGDNASMTQYSVTINGENGVCTEYSYDDTIVKLYSIGDKLIQIENINENGELEMQMVVLEITDQIPADQLTLKGYNEATIASFIASLRG